MGRGIGWQRLSSALIVDGVVLVMVEILLPQLFASEFLTHFRRSLSSSVASSSVDLLFRRIAGILGECNSC